MDVTFLMLMQMKRLASSFESQNLMQRNEFELALAPLSYLLTLDEAPSALAFEIAWEYKSFLSVSKFTMLFSALLD